VITITDVGAERVTGFLENRGKGLGLRVKIRTTGCSGYAYVLEFVDDLNDDDTVFNSNGIKIIVDTKSLAMIDGTELDYTTEGLNSGFAFKNPWEDAQCGCGESFTLKNKTQ
jgi:iron-sulfur cluster assembly protein|tara:strand:- start:131 stop:466 length:336 start_codon:yes stop_codon:yes gene_type:complete